MDTVSIGVLGGSGLYQMKELTDQSSVTVDTPFGKPSDARPEHARLQAGGVPAAPRPRPPAAAHGAALPANIHALKQLGMECVLGLRRGHMQEEIASRPLRLVDQFLDRTRGRPRPSSATASSPTSPFADPVCADLAGCWHAPRRGGRHAHDGGTYLCMEGPQFSTRAESQLYRTWGVDVIGMTNLPEAKLAREAEIGYATIALVTDYDCWHETEEV